MANVNLTLKNQKEFFFEMVDESLNKLKCDYRNNQKDVLSFKNEFLKSTKEKNTGIDLIADLGLAAFEVLKKDIDKFVVDGQEVYMTMEEELNSCLNGMMIKNEYKEDILKIIERYK